MGKRNKGKHEFSKGWFSQSDEPIHMVQDDPPRTRIKREEQTAKLAQVKTVKRPTVKLAEHTEVCRVEGSSCTGQILWNSNRKFEDGNILRFGFCRSCSQNYSYPIETRA